MYAWGLKLELYVYIALGLQYLVFFLHGLPYRSEKYYDLSGSATHFAVVAASLLKTEQVRSPRQLLVAIFSVVWMTRLGSFLYLRISKDGKDGRFDEPKRLWWSFMGFWTIQALWVILIQTPVIIINSRIDKTPIGPVDYVAGVLWVIGFLIESSADNEKFVFRSNPANRKTFINQGIWRYSRHPNYFGEILMWCSIALSVSLTDDVKGLASPYYAWLSPAFTTFLLLFVSGIPMVEKAGQEKWGHLEEYQHYTKNTSSLIPWFPAKRHVQRSNR